MFYIIVIDIQLNKCLNADNAQFISYVAYECRKIYYVINIQVLTLYATKEHTKE